MINSCKIHPAIGIARVGNSQYDDEGGYFIGPEAPGSAPVQPGFYKDDQGALRRQAARFRIFGYDEAGVAVAELTAADAEIQWTVHVANKKAAWYNFEMPMDIPEAIPCPRRNAAFVGDARRELVIDPGARSIRGRNEQGKTYRFDTGKFLGREVYLGEIRTDEQGNLIVLGGRGLSDTPFPQNTIYTYANNDGWFDDIADGPVQAQVKIDGRCVPVEPAWVVVAPPNYAPDIVSVQTMHDVIYDVSQRWWLVPIKRPSFTQHIYPLLCQFSEAQWVNFGFHVQFGWGAPYDFLRPDFFAKLASKASEFAEIRLQVFNQFRKPDYAMLEGNSWPAMYGDAAGLKDARQFMAVTATQYGYLKQWAAGDFDADWGQPTPDVRLADRPGILDREALRFCLGGPFHPGCEMTWIMRHVPLYYAPFRIRPRAANQPEVDYGDELTPAVATSVPGPLTGSGPGDITRWMAVPWQADAAACRAGYEREYDPYLPTFWPARVPNHVLSATQYATVMDEGNHPDVRMHAFHTRATWYRGLNGAFVQQVNQMVTDFGKFGVVERQPGPEENAAFPPVMYVESPPGFPKDVPAEHNRFVGQVEKVTRLPRVVQQFNRRRGT